MRCLKPARSRLVELFFSCLESRLFITHWRDITIYWYQLDNLLLDAKYYEHMKANSLVGTYNLVSWENRHASGDVTYPLGRDAKGYISYSPEGFVFVHIMANLRKKHTVEDLFGGDVSEIKDSATTHISYCGRYEIIGNEVIHYVFISSFPNWVSSQQRRYWEFRGDQLLLSAQGLQVGNEKVDAYLIWKRETPAVRK